MDKKEEKKIIKIRSRYGELHEFKQLNNDEFEMVSKTDHIRIGYNHDNSISFIDPPGGPFMMVGEKVPELFKDKILKEIIWDSTLILKFSK